MKVNLEKIINFASNVFHIVFLVIYLNKSYKNCHSPISYQIFLILEHFRKIEFFPNFNISGNPKKFDKCKLCSFRPNNGSYPPNSSPRDAIFLLGLNKLTNLLPIVKTLRTSGSKCRLFLFTDNSTISKYKSQPKFMQSLEDCGTEFINLGKVVTGGLFNICYLKYYIYKIFLNQNKFFFDRVIFMDLYDSIIQHDPFTTEFKHSLYLSNEGYIIKNDGFNTQYINSGYAQLKNHCSDPELIFSEEQKTNISNGYILNGGLQQGGVDALIKLCEIMEKSGNIKERKSFLLDQSFLNMIVHSGYLKKRMEYTILPAGNDLSSTIGIYVGKIKNVKFVFGNISRDGHFPAILHQFDRSGQIKDDLKKVCPNDENFTDYLRYR